MTTETHTTIDDAPDGYEAVEYMIDHNKSDDPEYGRKVERLANNTTIDVPVNGSDALLYECQRCGHRHTRAGYDETAAANTRATCSECSDYGGGITHDDHRVVAVKTADDADGTDDDDDDDHDVDQETIDELTSVDGVGEARAISLAEAGYETIEDLEEADADGLEDVDGIGAATAATIVEDLGDDAQDVAGAAPAAVVDGGEEIEDVPLPEQPPVLEVDWDGVEEDVEEPIPEEARKIIEATGSRYDLDKWGYGDLNTTELFVAIEERATWRLPDGTILDPDVAGKRQLRIGSELRALRGEDLNVGTLIEDGDDGLFVDGIDALHDAALELRDRRDDWYDDRAPTLSEGSHGPDHLGDHYVTAAHQDREVLEELDIDDLPIKLEHILYHKGWGDDPDHYTATWRHERYYDDADEPYLEDEYTDEAAEIGLLGSNLGTRTSIVEDLEERKYDYEHVDELEARGVHIDVYEYDKDGETRWVAEWSDRVAIDDIVWSSLVFGGQPDADAVDRAALIEEARLAGEGAEGSR